MTDNWSLKGKAVVIMCGIQGMYVFPENKKEHLPKDAVFVYKKQDIETLRQKLMEDVKELCDDRIGKAIISIINRRFGRLEDIGGK